MKTTIVDCSTGQTVTRDMTSQEEADFLASRPEPKYVTFKSDIWRRCTTDEAQMLDGRLQEADAHLRRLYEAVSEIHHDAPEFAVLRNEVVLALGGNAARADEILAPS